MIWTRAPVPATAHPTNSCCRYELPKLTFNGWTLWKTKERKGLAVAFLTQRLNQKGWWNREKGAGGAVRLGRFGKATVWFGPTRVSGGRVDRQSSRVEWLRHRINDWNIKTAWIAAHFNSESCWWWQCCGIEVRPSGPGGPIPHGHCAGPAGRRSSRAGSRHWLSRPPRDWDKPAALLTGLTNPW